MTPQTQKLFAEALRLPAEERAQLASQLFESTDQEFEGDAADEASLSDYAAEWSIEIQRREAEIQSGAVKPIAEPEALRLMFETGDG